MVCANKQRCVCSGKAGCLSKGSPSVPRGWLALTDCTGGGITAHRRQILWQGTLSQQVISYNNTPHHRLFAPHTTPPPPDLSYPQHKPRRLVNKNINDRLAE